jgi:hypothetical protein
MASAAIREIYSWSAEILMKGPHGPEVSWQLRDTWNRIKQIHDQALQS